MGGWSSEREISLRSGRNVCQSLKRQGFDAVEIDVDRNFANQLQQTKIDIAFVILHGKPGEDGTIQGALELAGIPYTGSGVEASAIGIDKITTKMLFERAGIPTPDYVAIPAHSNLKDKTGEAEERLRLPVVLKPRYEGSSVGVEIIKANDLLVEKCQNGRDIFGDIFLEKYVKGMIATVGIVGLRAMPVLELVPRQQEFYDFEAKYTKGATDFIVPARLDTETTEITQRLALLAHTTIGAEGFSRVDLVVLDNKQPMFLEINTLPGMTDLSDLPAEAASIGISYDELVFEILKSALRFFPKDLK